MKKYPTGCGAGISGPDVSKIKYEEATGPKNEHVCHIRIQNADDGYSSLTLAMDSS